MNLIKVKCTFCGREFFKSKGRVNEAKKFGWKPYCSMECQIQVRIKRIKKICSNPKCRKIFYRSKSDLKKSKSSRIFCSSRCAAIVNNSSRRKIKTCLVCNKNFYGERRYYSNLCRSRAVNPNKKSESEKQKIILNTIKNFYNTL